MKLYKALLLGLVLWVSLVKCTEDPAVGDDDDDEDEEKEKLSPLEEAKKNLKPGEEVISYKQPELTPEEQLSHHFPRGYYCEACQIVVHNMGTAFEAAEKKLPKKNKKRKLGDADVIEIVEGICGKNGFDKYSIQQYEGRVAFKGPAFPERDLPGMSMGGGLWPARYVNYCGNLLEDFEEDELYASYRSGRLFSKLCKSTHCKALSEVPKNVDFKPSYSSPKTEL